ncbi:hypothetical protein JTL82_32885 [Pseudomonas aeruginosa]|jgi:hypothetical protein|nr:hypothetical protein [Pseudomonas aeruginosa]
MLELISRALRAADVVSRLEPISKALRAADAVAMSEFISKALRAADAVAMPEFISKALRAADAAEMSGGRWRDVSASAASVPERSTNLRAVDVPSRSKGSRIFAIEASIRSKELSVSVVAARAVDSISVNFPEFERADGLLEQR